MALSIFLDLIYTSKEISKNVGINTKFLNVLSLNFFKNSKYLIVVL